MSCRVNHCLSLLSLQQVFSSGGWERLNFCLAWGLSCDTGFSPLILITQKYEPVSPWPKWLPQPFGCWLFFEASLVSTDRKATHRYPSLLKESWLGAVWKWGHVQVSQSFLHATFCSFHLYCFASLHGQFLARTREVSGYICKNSHILYGEHAYLSQG